MKVVGLVGWKSMCQHKTFIQFFKKTLLGLPNMF